MRKETVDINILVTSRNGDRQIIQSIRITSRPPLSIPIEALLHFDDGPWVQERQQRKDQQFCISDFVAYLTIPITVKPVQMITCNKTAIRVR